MGRMELADEVQDMIPDTPGAPVAVSTALTPAPAPAPQPSTLSSLLGLNGTKSIAQQMVFGMGNKELKTLFNCTVSLKIKVGS